MVHSTWKGLEQLNCWCARVQCGLMQNCEKIRLLLCKVRGRLDIKLQRASEFTREPENYTEAQAPTLVVLVALGGGGDGSEASTGRQSLSVFESHWTGTLEAPESWNV